MPVASAAPKAAPAKAAAPKAAAPKSKCVPVAKPPAMNNGQHRGKELYEVVAFLNIKEVGKKNEQYLVEWKDYPKEQATWEMKSSIPVATRTAQLAKYANLAKLTGNAAHHFAVDNLEI